MSTHTDITVKDNNLSARFRSKMPATEQKAKEYTRRLTNIAAKWVRRKAPRQTSLLRRSIIGKTAGTHGEVKQNPKIARYGKWVIEGHTLQSEKAKRWWFWHLEHELGGKYKRKTTGGTWESGPNDFFEKAWYEMQPEIMREIQALGAWMEYI